MNAACGPPNPIGTPKRWADPTAMSAPTWPGGTPSTQARRSVATTAMPPAACTCSIAPVQSTTAPVDVGRLNRAPKQPAAMASTSPTTSSTPIGSARVASTAIGLGMGVVVDHEAGRIGAGEAAGHRHRLGGGGRLVEQRGVGDREPGQLADHGLEVEQRLQPALADLRLVRGVRGVPGGVLEHVAADDRRGVGIGVPHADQARPQPVLVGEPAQGARSRRVPSGPRAGRAGSPIGSRPGRSGRAGRPATWRR